MGYCAVHIFEKEIRGVVTGTVRCEMGMVSEYRGGNVNARFVIARVLQYMMAHPGRPLFCLGSLVHPSSYAQLARYADRIYPNHAEETPEELLTLAPVSLGGVVRAAGRFAGAKAKRWSRNAIANVQTSLRGLLPEEGLVATQA